MSINKLIDWYNVLVNKDLEFFADYCVAHAFHVYLFKKSQKIFISTYKWKRKKKAFSTRKKGETKDRS